MANKCDWTMAKAREWVKEHEGKSANEISQESIIDEIDYLIIMIDKEGLGDKAKESFKELTKRLPASDIAVEDMTVKLEISDLPEVKEILNQAQEIIDNQAKETLTTQDILESIKRISK